MIDLVFNAGSGNKNLKILNDIKSGLNLRGVEYRLQVASRGSEIRTAADEAVKQATHPHAVVVAAGGDGTITAVAQALFDDKQKVSPGQFSKRLGILPLGTFNFTARNLNIPVKLSDALQLITENVAAPTLPPSSGLAVGSVNGHVFLNSASLGLYPEVLESRKQHYARFGRSRLVAHASVLSTILKGLKNYRLEINLSDAHLSRKTPLVYFGLNQLQLDHFGLLGQSCLDHNQFALFVTRPIGRMSLLKLAAKTYFKNAAHARENELFCAPEVVIQARRSKVLQVALDGEVRRLKGPLTFRLHPNELSVVRPG